jgi:hypothetical protein
MTADEQDLFDLGMHLRLYKCTLLTVSHSLRVLVDQIEMGIELEIVVGDILQVNQPLNDTLTSEV